MNGCSTPVNELLTTTLSDTRGIKFKSTSASMTTDTRDTGGNTNQQSGSKIDSQNNSSGKNMCSKTNHEKKMTGETNPIWCELPEFDSDNLELWLATTEIIFEENAITTERKMFSVLLQHLERDKSAPNLRSIVLDLVKTKP